MVSFNFSLPLSSLSVCMFENSKLLQTFVCEPETWTCIFRQDSIKGGTKKGFQELSLHLSLTSPGPLIVLFHSVNMNMDNENTAELRSSATCFLFHFVFIVSSLLFSPATAEAKGEFPHVSAIMF